MPRDGSNIYYKPAGTDGVPNFPIESSKYNAYTADVEQDLNLPRPIVAGGTGSSSADGALDNLSAEKFKQVVTDWDGMVWRAGSFYAATTATGTAPVVAHAFAGIAYYANATDFVLEARDLTDTSNPVYVRVMAAGVWGSWRNIGSTSKNYIINGAMSISQENGSTSGTTTNYYPADTFWMTFANAGTQTIQRVASRTPSGSLYRLRLTASVADASVASGDFCHLGTVLEGFRISDLNFGTGPAKPIVLQFGVRAPAGTYCVSFRNGGSTRNYVAEYVIASGEANTDVVKKIALLGDTTGTWTSDNTAGIMITWEVMAGATFQTATPGVWQGGNQVATANQFNLMGTAGNVFELFDVGLYQGNTPPPFVVPDYATEMLTCKRYFQNFNGTVDYIGLAGGWGNAGATIVHYFQPETEMRATPTVTVGTSGWGLANCSVPVVHGATAKTYALKTTAIAAGPYATALDVGGIIKLDARL